MIRFRLGLAGLALAIGTPVISAQAGVPVPNMTTPKAIDAGSLAPSQAAMTVTIAMKLHDAAGAHALLQTLYTPGDPGFQKFITPAEFQARFAPTDAEVAKVAASLTRFGLTVARATSTTLSVTGSPAQFEQAFQTKLHRFHVAASGSTPGYSYQKPTVAPTVPDDVASLVHAVVGLSTQPHFHPHLRHAADKIGATAVTQSAAPASDGGNTSGNLTVLDFARRYGVKALYDHGVDGSGKTIGIVTLASFTPGDAFAYWTSVGLKVDRKRITVVDIDGGPGAPSDDSGSDETTLDVEQSGGVAPAAKIIVYQAPNTNQGYLDAFARAIDANTADAISTSWGEWEWFDDKANSPVADPYTGRTVGALQAQHELFLQAALQGQSLFAAAGDSGAYDANEAPFAPPSFSLALSVDSPASDPYITAAGGTTLPGVQTYSVGTGKPPITVDIKKERAWSWDYLVPLCTALGYDPIGCGIFPVGGGGGVSVFFKRPFYQDWLAGIQSSQPHQAIVDETQTPPQTVFKLPANFAGRNVPDISANADPDTGYQIYYTSDQSGFGILTFYGGTSFVAPQLAGVTTLMADSLHHRIGLLNIPLYQLGKTNGYSGSDAPLTAIKYGNNDYYVGSDGYNPAVGLGVLDVGQLTKALKDRFGY
jgi:subtilase family serine protease